MSDVQVIVSESPALSVTIEESPDTPINLGVTPPPALVEVEVPEDEAVTVVEGEDLTVNVTEGVAPTIEINPTGPAGPPGDPGTTDYNELDNVPTEFPPAAHAASHTDGTDQISNATTSAAGLESVADKTKLDGIESNATADQTAAEILTAIKTVDGDGSGLDADTLDGTDSSEFSFEGHEHDHIVNLETDSRLMTDPPTDYPMGFSSMPSVDYDLEDGFSYLFHRGAVETNRHYNATDDEIQCVQVLKQAASDGGELNWRYWLPNYEVWQAWQTVNAPHEHDHVANLEPDSRLTTDDPTAFPIGTSYMPSPDYVTDNTFGAVRGTGLVETFRYISNFDGEVEVCVQTLHGDADTGALVTWRYWVYQSNEWSTWQNVNRWTDVYNKPDTFPPEAHEHDDAYVNEEDFIWDNLDEKPSTFPPDAHAASHKGDGSDPIADATASVAGLESAADKTKLDGIEAGATADQTASEILTAIKTVDGSGSGLDADLLDGHDTAYFATASDLTTKADLVSGVVPTSQLPALAINDVFTVASQAAMLALTAQRGDIAVRTDFDPDRTYMLSTDSPGTLADWIRVTFGDVVSVNGQTGVIVLGYSDVGAASTSDTRIPTQDENDALAGTNGTPSTSNKYVTNSDSRNTDTRTPTDDSVTNAKVAAAAAIAESKLNLASDAAAGTASRRTLGTGATQAAAGNDSRLSDSRTPTSHATSHVTGGSDVIANAVAGGNAGLFSGTDKTKLDGVETGATADQTAAEILTAIKTVDGTGSGLDADTLDGTSSAGFAAASHATSHVTGGSDVIANAVAGGNAGLISGTDKTKLDGVETGATGDQTAAEILTAIKTVDGTGSGLDADLLDGTTSAGFATASHSHLIADLPVADDGESNSAEVVRSNDARLSNSRTPTAHKTSHEPGGSDAMTVDAAAATGSLRTLGTTSTSAAAGDHTHVGGSAFTLNETEANLGSIARRSGKFNITSSGLTTGKHVLIQQLNGPYTGKGTRADEAEMDEITATAKVTSATNIECYWRSPTVVRGNIKFGYAVSA